MLRESKSAACTGSRLCFQINTTTPGSIRSSFDAFRADLPTSAATVPLYASVSEHRRSLDVMAAIADLDGSAFSRGLPSTPTLARYNDRLLEARGLENKVAETMQWDVRRGDAAAFHDALAALQSRIRAQVGAT